MHKLIEWFEAGRGRRKLLADALGISPAAISQWSQVPATQATRVAEVTGIEPHVLRPDVFPVPEKVA